MKKYILPLLLAACTAQGQVSGTLPKPSARQLAWQQLETTAFLHFTVNTYTDKEWGEGDESPSIFNPTKLDAMQWAKALKAGGFKIAIITAKHHDGFCLWPSKYTEHSIKNSPYKNGKGDIVKELSEACKAVGIKFGVYLSPWDRHEKVTGLTPIIPITKTS
jgi:alpha-L-fucosidase